jgi:prephenate dehydratase
MAAMKVAFQGERGAFSEQAARQMAGKLLKLCPCESFEDVFEGVAQRQVDVGVVPIENSLIGSICANYDLLLGSDLKIIDETQVRIVHSLIVPPGTSLKKLNRAYSHPAALDQCRRFFKEHRNIEPVSFYDTAGAVKMLAEEELPDAAAIASPYAASLYGMKVLRKSIEDEKVNYTRFLMLARRSKRVVGKAKTSVVFALKNEPGSLFKALSVFTLRDIDLNRIESRPSRQKAWEYHFYVDFAGSTKDEPVKKALRHLAEVASFVKVFGSYPMRVKG